MTNTLNNVPRELLAGLLQNYYWQLRSANGLASYAGGTGADEQPAECADQIHALLSAPSPAGVDGLPEFLTPELEELGREAVERAIQDGCNSSRSLEYAYGEAIRKHVVDNAQAIIDGLRGEVAEERSKVAQLEEGVPRIMEASYQFRTERDHQARRIVELEGLLRACLVEFGGDYTTLTERIDAALSAGKDSER